MSANVPAALIRAPVLNRPPCESDQDRAVEALREGGCPVRNFEIEAEDFRKWLQMIDYEERSPIYPREYGPPRHPEGIWLRKRFEHFLSYRLAEISEGSRVMDVAAANAPVQRLWREVFGVREAWRQDWTYETNLAKKTLGGDARSIPVPDESFDALVLHNAWEHFEGESDVEFLVEAERILIPGGRLVITPLFFSFKGWVATSPSVWADKYAGISSPPEFRPKIPVLIDEGIRQRYAQRHSSELLLAHFKRVPQLTPTLLVLDNPEDFAGYSPYTLTLVKDTDAASSNKDAHVAI